MYTPANQLKPLRLFLALVESAEQLGLLELQVGDKTFQVVCRERPDGSKQHLAVMVTPSLLEALANPGVGQDAPRRAEAIPIVVQPHLRREAADDPTTEPWYHSPSYIEDEEGQ